MCLPSLLICLTLSFRGGRAQNLKFLRIIQSLHQNMNVYKFSNVLSSIALLILH